jgi:hypothetical protein
MEKNIRTTSDSTLYVSLAVTFLIISLLAFVEKLIIEPLLLGEGTLSAAKIIHGILFFSWLLLFLTQAILIKKSNFKYHKYFGYGGIGLITLVLLDGSFMSAEYANEFIPTDNIGDLIIRASGVWANTHVLLATAILVVIAVVYRRNPPLHQRLMLLTTISMMSGPLARIASFGVIPMHKGAIVFVGLLILLLIPILYELIKYKKVSRVYLWNLPIYFVTLIIFAAIIPTTPWGQTAVFWFK